ncbi:MAG: YbaB/EbfC family nucleoid-associated protein [Nitrospinae bacterium]|nr:YbaB/EbfC family nucleoid-associated protein [Nitrospinota bacterium]
MSIKNFSNLFKQAQEMQSRMAEIQQELARKTVEASVGGGMVKMTANGLNQVLAVHIDKDLINLQDREILEDLVLGAVNEIRRKVKELSQDEMSKLTGGIKVPGLFPS